jgi:hypothetical protein
LKKRDVAEETWIIIPQAAPKKHRTPQRGQAALINGQMLGDKSNEDGSESGFCSKSGNLAQLDTNMKKKKSTLRC